MLHLDSIEVAYIRKILFRLGIVRYAEENVDEFTYRDNSLFATVKDYLAVEKGWFSPYLFASGRRPIIPRSMKPDITFCHGPFLFGM